VEDREGEPDNRVLWRESLVCEKEREEERKRGREKERESVCVYVCERGVWRDEILRCRMRE
jgi:hypothetical protein